MLQNNVPPSCVDLFDFILATFGFFPGMVRVYDSRHLQYVSWTEKPRDLGMQRVIDGIKTYRMATPCFYTHVQKQVHVTIRYMVLPG